jgi:predicted nucleotide-binding protein
MTAIEPRARLKIPREDARERLLLRIQEGRKLIANPIQSGDQFNKVEEEQEKWRAYNRELLSRQLFTTDEYADEYRGSFKLIHVAGDRYDTPSLTAFAARLNYSITNQVACLESIVERLELINEVMTERFAVSDRSKIFVVHGHDEGALQAMARFLEGIGLQAIILREQPDRGRTTIEKFEACSVEVGFTVVLLTPDDLGGATAAPEQAARARQNVIFELGYFVGSLGRGRACLLRKGNVEIPSDLFGVIYTDFDHPGEGWKIKLARELKAGGFEFDADKVLA